MTLGLSKDDFGQAVSIFHQLLGIGYSIEENLDPKEPWLKTLGLPRDQAAKVVSTFSRFRAKTIVRWLMSLGLTRDLKQDRKNAQLRGSHGGQVSKSVSWLLLEFKFWIVRHAINLSFSEHNNFMTVIHQTHEVSIDPLHWWHTKDLAGSRIFKKAHPWTSTPGACSSCNRISLCLMRTRITYLQSTVDFFLLEDIATTSTQSHIRSPHLAPYPHATSIHQPRISTSVRRAPQSTTISSTLPRSKPGWSAPRPGSADFGTICGWKRYQVAPPQKRWETKVGWIWLWAKSVSWWVYLYTFVN